LYNTENTSGKNSSLKAFHASDRSKISLFKATDKNASEKSLNPASPKLGDKNDSEKTIYKSKHKDE
jgi:hypothetical protein